MTVRPLKSTRFPLRLPRKRPCLPFSRCTNPRSGLPGVWKFCGSPGSSLARDKQKTNQTQEVQSLQIISIAALHPNIDESMNTRGPTRQWPPLELTGGARSSRRELPRLSSFENGHTSRCQMDHRHSWHGCERL
eukprot:389015-Pyramimonas_sp.AAC.1